MLTKYGRICLEQRRGSLTACASPLLTSSYFAGAARHLLGSGNRALLFLTAHLVIPLLFISEFVV